MYITLSYAPVRDERGAVGGVLATAFGVDDQVAARGMAHEREALQAEANAERERLRSLIVHMPAPVALLLGPEHRHALVNEAFRRISGGGRDVTGLPVREAFPELEGQGIYETLDRVYATGEPFVAPGSHVRYDRDGTGVRDSWFDVRFVAVRDAAGAVIGILNFAVDVTEQVLARRATDEANATLQATVAALGASEARLQESEAATRRAFDELEATYRTAPVGLAVIDRDLRFVRINERLAEINGTSVAAHVGRTVHEIIPEIADLVAAALREVMDSGEPRYDVPIAASVPSAPDVVRHWVEHWLPLRNAAGAVVGINIVAEEVSERIRADAERERLLAAEREARAEAEAANRAKSEFLAVMSHELRTPLNAIGGYAELIEMGIRGPVTELQREDLARIQKSQRHLLGLINGVLNYARVEGGHLQYEVTDVPVDEVLATAEALIAPQVRAKAIAFHFGGCPPTLLVRGDHEKVQQIVLNLLSNAVKFTEPGGRVELTCAAEGAHVTVTVSDSGRGIAPGQLSRVFEPFVQVDARLTRTQEGVGLGLAISRDLARGMGGDLTAESTLGEGSSFTLSLPAA
jgi:PAS domain S-box-containing protein